MATIRATCGDCGDVEVTSLDVQVRTCVDDNTSTYLFRCPCCRMAVVKPAEPRVVELLVATGVAASAWALPAELHEPRAGAPLSHDDLLDFHALLERDDWFGHLEAMTGH